MTDSFSRVSSLDEVKDQTPTYLAIGVFDGVHLGHQNLLDTMVDAAQEAGTRPAVLTFFPHPGSVITGRQGRIYLCTLEDRVSLLAEQGIELVIVHPFNEEVRYTSATHFVDNLCRHLELRQLWGGNFSLGHNREGDATFLRDLGREMAFEVRQIEAMTTWAGRPVSSSRVRRSLAQGDIGDAAGCLGRPYRLRGRVVEGDGRGRQIGVPTANIGLWDEMILPARGVYATYAWVGERRYRAAANVGIRPTVGGETLTVEAHLLDFSGDLYGAELALEFVTLLRDEMKFENLQALVQQIQADIAKTRHILPLDND